MFVLYLLAEEYDRHMAGKRHNERLQAYIEKKKTAECSVFVKGFPPRTAEDELMLYFQSFGMINKIVMEIHEKKKVCQGFQYFSSLPVLHYIQAILSIKIWTIFMVILYTLKNQEVSKTILGG